MADEPIKTYEENGVTIKVYPPGFARGVKPPCTVKTVPRRKVSG